jgi:hypothetical protein
MGCAFKAVFVPKKHQTQEQLQEFYSEYQGKLVEEYGEDFEGYSGDIASDSSELVVTELKLPELPVDHEGLWDELMELCTGHCEKWGPSIAVRVGDQWAICGAYSDSTSK